MDNGPAKKLNTSSEIQNSGDLWADPFEISTLRRDVSNEEADWATAWHNQQSDCAPSEDSDQPGHSPSLIRVFAVRMKKPWVLSYPLSAQRRLWSDWADAQADLSLCWAHTHFVGYVMLWLNYPKYSARAVLANNVDPVPHQGLHCLPFLCTFWRITLW